MNTRKIIAFVFILIAISLGVHFYLDIQFPTSVQGYFSLNYIGQFGPLAISIELLIAGIYLGRSHSRANFTLALFGFTALLDPFFDLTGIFSTLVPVYAMILFVLCALASLWMAFTNAFDLGKISFIGAVGSFVLGAFIELFFNYMYQLI